MGEASEVVQASAETLKTLGDRGIKLGLHIYSPAEEDDDYGSFKAAEAGACSFLLENAGSDPDAEAVWDSKSHSCDR